MCGIAGIFDNRGIINCNSALDRALEMMKFRGPDDRGVHREKRWAIGMQRLSIVDKEKGKQPQGNDTGDILIVHNGEIYNHEKIKAELQQNAHRFKTSSDTEVIVHGYERWGIEGVLNRIEGMYAFAIIDKKKGLLHLARDRFGEKPLYFYAKQEKFAFSSDLKALVNALDLNAELDPLSLRRYLALHYIPGNRSIIEGISRVLPGERVEIDLGSLSYKRHAYYKPPACLGNTFDPSKLEELLVNAVESRMMGEVPVGVFLSGGLDSSIVTALAAKRAPKLETFSIGFDSREHDESTHAQEVAKAIGVSNRQVTFTERDFRELLPIVATQLDEPLGDPATLPTSRLCKVAKEHVKVILSGEGADELFGGYQYYHPYGSRRSWLRRLLGTKTTSPNSRLLDPQTLRTPSGFPLVCGKAEWESLATLVPAEDSDAWEQDYLATVNAFQEPLSQATMGDFLTWLPDNLLVKLDRMTMSHSLEGRSPFLMHSLVEYAISLPAKYKIKGEKVKWALRTVANRHLPDRASQREKQGFVLPMANWLRRYVESHGGVYEFVRQRNCKSMDEQHLIEFLSPRLKEPLGHERILYSLIHLIEWLHHLKN